MAKRLSNLSSLVLRAACALLATISSPSAWAQADNEQVCSEQLSVLVRVPAVLARGRGLLQQAGVANSADYGRCRLLRDLGIEPRTKDRNCYHLLERIRAWAEQDRVGTFSKPFLDSIAAFIDPTLTCVGPKTFKAESYQDVAMWNLYVDILTGTELDPAKYGLQQLLLDDATPLPLGDYNLDDAIAGNRYFSTKEEFATSQLAHWLVKHQDYQKFRGDGYSNQEIITAAVDLYAQGGTTDARGLRNVLVLNRAAPWGRAIRTCLMQRFRAAIRNSSESKRLLDRLKAAASPSDMDRVSKEIEAHQQQLKRVVNCKAPDGKSVSMKAYGL
jgi:hypothetical protein